ncbi:hypothetical protein [Spirosoma flavum]|uniref:Helix-turn-helix domain-containing protein n=1 Tax=Spirosoma flavum TaxID=2048557 RepID=A0ABW6AGN7_9BACT
MEQAKHFLKQYQGATSREERSAILAEYQTLLETLSTHERDEVRQFMKSHLQPQIKETLQTLDALVEKADLLLSQKGMVTYEGKEYVFGDWVTIADYCRLYDFKPARVQNWIDREIVPRQNVVIIHELNNLKLLKNELYRP